MDRGAQEVRDTDELPGAALESDENDMPIKIESSNGNASMSPVEKKTGVGALPSESEKADKQEVPNETVHEESEQNEGSGRTMLAKLGAVYRKGKESIGCKFFMGVIGGSAALGFALGYGKKPAKNPEESISSDPGKANEETRNMENQVRD